MFVIRAPSAVRGCEKKTDDDTNIRDCYRSTIGRTVVLTATFESERAMERRTALGLLCCLLVARVGATRSQVSGHSLKILSSSSPRLRLSRQVLKADEKRPPALIKTLAED